MRLLTHAGYRAVVSVARPEHIDLAVPAEPQPLARIMRHYPSPWAVAGSGGFFAVGGITRTNPLRTNAYGWLVRQGFVIQESTGLPRPVFCVSGGRASILDGDPPRDAAVAVEAGPWLVRGGQATDIAAEERRGGYTGLQIASRRPRAGIGVRPDGLVVYAALASGTLADLQGLLAADGCRDAMALDGGGSVGVVQRGQAAPVVGGSVRALPAAIVIREEAEVVQPEPEQAEAREGLSSRRYIPGVDLATPLTDETARALRAAGYQWVARYLVPDRPAYRWKRLTRAEAEAISRAGLRIVSVWELTARRPIGGAPVGEADGRAAAEEARALGQSPGSAVYLAVDFDAQSGDRPRVLDYLRAAAGPLRAAGYRPGVYGSYDVVDWALEAGAVELAWQTYAWSEGRLHHGAALYQYRNGVQVSGLTVDLDRCYVEDPGWWLLGDAPAVEWDSEEEGGDVPTVRQGDRGEAVRLLQAILRALGYDPGPVDGIFGERTETAVRLFQAAHGIAVDGVVGPGTWGAVVETLDWARVSAPADPDRLKAAVAAAEAAKAEAEGRARRALERLRQIAALAGEPI